MADDISLDDQKKMVLPFMQRAQEIEKVDLKVAYYCRMYAIEQALSIPKRAKEINALVSAAISRLEKDKASLTLDKSQDRVHCEAFALRVFANADKVDRMGKADVGTSKGFYAASCFIDILNQFSANDADMLGKQKYSLWRAAEIRKALREGRPPLPPPSGEAPPEGPSGVPDLGGIGSFSMAGVRPLDTDAGSFSGTSAAPPPPSFPPPPPPAQAAAPPAPFPQQPPAPFAPQQPPAPPSWGQGAPAVLPGQRYKPGSPVLFCESAGIGKGSEEEKGTIGQITLSPDGLFRYRVALKDRLVQANDMQVAPCPPEGSQVTFTPRPGAPPTSAHVVLVNDGMGWPPTYLVALPDGAEVSAQSHQLSMLSPEESAPPPAPAPAPPPPPAGWGADPHLVSHLSSGSNQSNQSSGYPTVGLDHTTTPQSGPSWSSAPPPAQPPMPPPTSQTSSLPRPGPPPPAATQYPQQGSWQAPPPPPQQQPAPLPPPPAGWITIAPLQPNHKPSIQAINEAQKAARTAVSSLNFEDVASAVKYLTHALEVLTATPGTGPAHR